MTEEEGRDADGRGADDRAVDSQDADERAADGRDTDAATQTLGDISHTHPYTNETFGGIYRRGPAIADGGAEPTAVGSEGESSADAESDDCSQTMGEIDHTPRDLNVNNVWDRGSARSVPGDD
ncbi:MAG: hypothetical protein ABEH81_05795 [Halopenitus sp.]